MSLRVLYANRSVIALLSLALGARIVTSALQVYFYPSSFTLPFPLTAWGDFYATYVGWLHLVSQGMIPYRDFFTYTYTPLFLYALYPFYLIGGAHAASIPIFVSDAATSPLVYLLAKRLTSQRVAFAAGLMYAICPLALFYEGYLWLSSQPMAFFLLVSIYLMRSEKSTASFVAYGVSIMLKQEAIFVFPVFLWWQVMMYKRRVWKGICLLALVIFVVSLPFLLTSGSGYITEVSYQYLGLGAMIQAGISHVSVPVSSVAQTTSPLVLVKSCPETLPTGTPFFTCTRYSLVLYFLSWMSDTLFVPLFFLAGAAVLLSRRARDQVELLLSYSLVCFLVLFSLTVHVILAYYFVPFYALVFSSARTRSALIAPLVASASSLILPAGNFTLMMALGSVLVLVALQDRVSGPWEAKG